MPPVMAESLSRQKPRVTGEKRQSQTESEGNQVVRRWHLEVSAVWGAGLIADARARAVLVYLLPTDVMVGVSAALAVVVFAALIAWTAWDRKRRQAARAS